MYIKREYCPGLHMLVYTYSNEKEARQMQNKCKFSKIEYDEISNTWKITIF